MPEFLKFLGDFSVYSALACGLLYFIGFAKQGKAYKIFTIYLVVISLILLYSYYIGRGGLGKPNLFLSHYYFIAQFVLLSLFYRQFLKSKLIEVITVLVLFFLAYQYITDPEIYHRYNPVGMTITHIVIVVYALIYLYKSLSNSGDFVLVNIGVLIYLLSSTLIFASGNLVFNLNISPESLNQLISVNTVLYLVFQILIIFEWVRIFRKK